MDRRTELLEAALGYVLDHGLIGLSLRPLAAALGTSDRMLIYHFDSKDALISEIVALANRRLGEALTAGDQTAHSPGDLVRLAWRGLHDAAGITRLYLEMCALSLGGPAAHDGAELPRTDRGSNRWAEAHRELREPWLAMLREGLAEMGTAPATIEPLAVLVLDSIDGLLLDRRVTGDVDRTDAAAAAFADLLDDGHTYRTGPGRSANTGDA